MPFPLGMRPVLFAALFCALLVPLRADYKDDIGYTKLVQELGSALPTGAGIGVSQVEAPLNTASPFTYLPDTTLSELSGKTYTVKSPAGGLSGHATTVAQIFFGSASSVAPGVTNIHSYEANNWLQSGFLKYNSGGSPAAPLSESQMIVNCSWIANLIGNPSAEAEILRRFDYAVEDSQFLGVVALNNGNAGNVPWLLGSCYNGISVGLTNGGHSYGTNTTDGAGRTKPEIVAPQNLTSFATPIVASTAAMLSEVAPPEATKPVTMKAILMAGATKSQFPAWSRTTTRPIDSVYGAGQVNVYNSHRILAEGRQTASASLVRSRRGWDFGTTTAGSQLYFFDLPAGGPSSLSAILTWNRVIGGTFPNPTSSLANLTLNLYAASGFTLGTLVDSSASTVDNVEHVWQTSLAPGRYAMEVTSDTSGISYGLAWNSVPTVTIAATIPTAAETGPVAGQFTITRGGDTSGALTVTYAISGTATNGTDYASIPASVTIPIGASSATIAVTPIPDNLAEGPETVVVSLTGDPLYTIGAAGSATVTIQDKPIDAWRFANFTAPELADSALSGDLADFEKDGIVNLNEYAFGLAPKTSDTTGLPVVSVPSPGMRAIAYTRVKSATDITYTVEVSNNLSDWFSGAGYTSVLSTADHGATETVTVGSLLAPAAGKQFLRVRITRP